MKQLTFRHPFKHLTPSLHSAGRRSGMSMVELVAALAIFMALFGILLIALNSATNLWGKSRVQNQELPLAQQIVDIIAEDLYQAVTDTYLPEGERTDTNPLFIQQNIDPDTIPLSSPVVLLAFPRYANRFTLDPNEDQTTRLGLDAVFYTYYQRALFRQAIPIHTRFDRSETLGELIKSYLPVAELPSTHDNLLSVSSDSPPLTSGTMLSWNIIPTFIPYYTAPTPQDMVDYPQPLLTNALPNMLDVSLHIFEDSDWEQYQTLRHNASLEAQTKLKHLGTLFSRRITLPQAGGVHLP